MTGNPEHEQIRRMVVAMEDVADTYADQNLWDLARRAWAAIRDTKTTDVEAALSSLESILSGDPDAKGPTIAERVRAVVNAKYELENRVQRTESIVKTADEELQRIGRTEMHGSLLQRLITTIRQSSNDSTRLDRAEKFLRELAHILSPTQPIGHEVLASIAADLMEQHAMLTKGVEQLRRELGEKDKVFQGIVDEIRKALDPDEQFEDESITVLARERMSQWAARGQERDKLRKRQEQQGTLFEEASAERMRKLLGAQEGESLAAAAMRNKHNAKGGWDKFQKLEKDTREFEKKIRELTGAVDMFEDDDTYVREQPTMDAVRRLIRAYTELIKERQPDVPPELEISKSWRETMLQDVQRSWSVDHTEFLLPGEDA